MIDLAVPSSQLILAIPAAAIISLVAWRASLLRASGAIAATLLGTGLVSVGGWWLGAVLITFFVTASVLPSSDRSAPARNGQQVAANGGPALAFGLVSVLTNNPAWLIGAVATIAAAASDTWATELGRAYGGTPISIRTRRPTAPGTSGAISLVGTLGSAAGAVVIAIVAVMLIPLAPNLDTGQVALLAIVAGSGLIGSVIDTILGAWVQARFICTTCGHRSESPTPHQPGHSLRVTSGLSWMTNSIVNLVATTASGVAGTLCALL